MKISLRLWGTRGWLSAPSLQTVEYGSHTTCLQILGEDVLVGVDAGTGLARWGELLAQQAAEVEIHLFLTRFHTDHLEGLPFFLPIYSSSTRLYLYAPYPKAYTQENIERVFTCADPTFAGLDSLPSHIAIVEMREDVQLGDLRIQLGARGTAPGVPYSFTALNRIVVASQGDQLVPFAAHADLLVLDAACTEAEKQAGYPGWDGGTYEQALAIAQACGAKELLCTHHGPYRTDKSLSRLEGVTCAKAFYCN